MTEIETASPEIVSIEVGRLRAGRYQNRTRFPDDGLTESVARSGVIQPIIVRGGPETYEIIAGERRWRASQACGKQHIPAIVRNDLADVDVAIICLVENIQRQSLNAIDEARGLNNLIIEFELTHVEIAERVSKSRTYVTNTLRLLNLDEDVQGAILDGDIEAGHGKALVGLAPGLQKSYVSRIKKEGWSVRKLEKEVASFKGLFKPPEPEPNKRDADIEALAARLSESLGVPVTIDYNAEKGRGGTINIRFFNLDDSSEIIDRLLGSPRPKSVK